MNDHTHLLGMWSDNTAAKHWFAFYYCPSCGQAISESRGPLSDEPRELEWETTADGRRTWLRKSGLWRVSRGHGGKVWLTFADAHLKCVDSIEEAQFLAASLQSVLDGRPLWKEK